MKKLHEKILDFFANPGTRDTWNDKEKDNFQPLSWCHLTYSSKILAQSDHFEVRYNVLKQAWTQTRPGGQLRINKHAMYRLTKSYNTEFDFMALIPWAMILGSIIIQAEFEQGCRATWRMDVKTTPSSILSWHTCPPLESSCELCSTAHYMG